MTALDRATEAIIVAIDTGASHRAIAAAAFRAVAEMDEEMFRFFFHKCVRLQPKIVNDMAKIHRQRMGKEHPHEPGGVTAHRRMMLAIAEGKA